MTERTLATRYFMQSHGDFELARKELYRIGIKTSYNDDVVICSTLHTNKSNLDNPYAQECNGLVLDRDNYQALVVPPRTLRFNIDTDASNVFLHQGLYHIYKAADGTCFNMYYFKGKWIISTAKGHSMNDVKWDSKTYQETIIECIETLGLDWTTFTAALDKTKCYSFGFSHPSRHKFCITPKVWFIQSVVTDEKSAQYLWASDQTPIELIPTQELYNMPVGTLRELYKKSSSALEDFLNTGEVCFGFIMRSVNPSLTKNSSDLFIESSLMRAIRRFWYENTLIDLCHKNNWNMEKAITLQAYLDTTNQQTFLKLFPQYTETFNKYSVEVMKLVNEMITSTLTKNTSESTTVNTLLQLFRDTVSYNTTNVNKEILATVYSDFVRHPDSLEILMSAWN